MKAPNEGAREVRWCVESDGGPWARCKHKQLTYGEAMVCRHLSPCGAEIVPCLGILPAGTARLPALDVTFEKRTPPHGFGLGKTGGEFANAR